jgi:hypothetical protein
MMAKDFNSQSKGDLNGKEEPKWLEKLTEYVAKKPEDFQPQYISCEMKTFNMISPGNTPTRKKLKTIEPRRNM